MYRLLSVVILVSVFAVTPVIASGWLDIGKQVLSSQVQKPAVTSSLSTRQMSSAFKQALSIGVDNVIATLGQKDGFALNEDVHIPLPKSLAMTKKYLAKIGMSPLLDDLESKLNTAAEQATPHAKELFVDAISQMRFEDVKKIYSGPNNSATMYFQEKMSVSLRKKMRPIVQKEVSSTGVMQVFDNIVSKQTKNRFMPFLGAVGGKDLGKLNLTDYALDKAISGVFLYLGKEEAAIRTDPLKQTTGLLKQAFGAFN